jgi:hypothetical protein
MEDRMRENFVQKARRDVMVSFCSWGGEYVLENGRYYQIGSSGYKSEVPARSLPAGVQDALDEAFELSVRYQVAARLQQLKGEAAITSTASGQMAVLEEQIEACETLLQESEFPETTVAGFGKDFASPSSPLGRLDDALLESFSSSEYDVAPHLEGGKLVIEINRGLEPQLAPSARPREKTFGGLTFDNLDQAADLLAGEMVPHLKNIPRGFQYPPDFQPEGFEENFTVTAEDLAEITRAMAGKLAEGGVEDAVENAVEGEVEDTGAGEEDLDTGEGGE